MGIIVNREENRTDLQKRIAAELTEKAKKKPDFTQDRPDGIEDSAYIEGTKKTTSLAWLWAVVIVAFVAALLWIIIKG